MAQKTVRALILSPGAAAGPVFRDSSVSASCGENVLANRKDIPEAEREAERELLFDALDRAAADLLRLAERVRSELGSVLGSDKAEIFEGHADILQDEDFRNDMARLVAEGYSAQCAALAVAESNALDMEALDDEYFRERSSDFRELGRKVADCASALRSGTSGAPGYPGAPGTGCLCGPVPPVPSIVVAEELSPARTVQYHVPNVLGFIVSRGGANSHAAILSRSLGIPAAVVSSGDLALFQSGAMAAINADPDTATAEPDEESVGRALSAALAASRRKDRLAQLREFPAVTSCGHRIGLFANVCGMKDLPAAAAEKADGIGLFRTEFLFMEETSFPDEQKQAAYYRQALETLRGKPVIFRLLDIGGDKPLPYDPQPPEANPFLGVRGIRYLLARPELLASQIRALLLASAASGQTVRIMVPMVCLPSEMKAVREIAAAEERRTGGHAVIGMMVETPAVAMSVRAYSGLSEFISIGTNDLTQYSLAVDREHDRLAGIYDEFHPGVLSLMAKACADARHSGMETGVCGEFASRPEAAVLLAAMGFDELSMRASAIASVKEAIRSCTMREAGALLERALAESEAEGARTLARAFLAERGLGG